MREIKFRAKRTDGLGWVYGYFVKTPITAEFNIDPKNGAFFDSGVGRYCIVTEYGVAHEIDINTLGQFTDFHDKTGKKIYEGDILTDGLEVIWVKEAAAFRFNPSRENKDFSFTESPLNYSYDEVEVIGNIYENLNY